MIPSLFLRALTVPDADRPAVLEALLRDRGVASARIPLAGSLHLAVKFPDSSYNPRYRTKLLVAHHDRRPGSSGALDNGAACLQLADLAGRLALREEPHNTVILFTDSEESSGAGDQGSFAVARALAGRVKALAGEGEEPPAVFVFDVTGRGTVPILSTTARDLLASRG
ncbi:MAG TPA: M28 family peptidase, partial [Spirochaetia bacterium]|nr:M28 family peptidase [Spirochaetia bacterium]